MALYGRSDVISVAVPRTAGGCGGTHSRPVAEGVAVDEWDLEAMCVMCALALRGDPLWAATPAEVPETPDERNKREDAEKRGERALKKAQEQTNVKLTEVTAQIVELLKQQAGGAPVVSEDVVAKLVAEHVARAIANGTVPVSEAREHTAPILDSLVGPDSDLTRLHVRTLGKMCRDRGLDDKGGKADLIARLSASAGTE